MEQPAGFRYIDAHTHLHPPWLAQAIRRWFAERTHWRLDYPTEPAEVAAFLRARGVERFAFFSYAHKAGIAREINRWLRETARGIPDGLPLATVHPDDDDPVGVVETALEAYGFYGLKCHIQVQRFYPDDPRMLPVYARLVEADRVLVIHAGTAPHGSQFVGLERLARVLERFPDLRVALCHMGAYETPLAFQLLERFPNLFLDTTMAMTPASTPYTGIEPGRISDETLCRFADRILFGSDFPNLPYDYEEERRGLWDRDLPLEVYRKIFYANALRFFRPGPAPGIAS